MRTGLVTVIAWIVLPVVGILGLTRLWPEGLIPTVTLLALAILPGSALAIRRARRRGATGVWLALAFLAGAALAIGAVVFLAQYAQYYRLHSLITAPLLAFVALPLLLTVSAAIGALSEAQARRRGIREAGAASLAIGAVALTFAALLAVVVLGSASERRARSQGRGELGPFFEQLVPRVRQ